MTKAKINPNGDKDYIDQVDLVNAKNFPKFLKSISLSPFRHIENLTVSFNHPISIVAGTNRSGKSTLLMALACSHFLFQKRNVQNGKLERHTWSSLMQFTNHDKQARDWTYHITYKLGEKIESKRGQRKSATQKWNGIGKKESQFKDRQVIFIDLDRVAPARHFGKTIFNKATKAQATHISAKNVGRIEEYLSFILEDNIKLSKLADHLDKDIFKYTGTNEYSSYNAATGEEVLTKILIDVVEAPDHSLILIDEIEVGLHPKIQRRLMQVLYHVARSDSKQFIVTTHSPSILSSVPDKARTFVERTPDAKFKAIANISVNAALSKMDSTSYPLVDLFCEDREAKKIIDKAISSIQSTMKLNNFVDLVNIIVSGSDTTTYSYFKAHQATYSSKRIKTGCACVLDGDRKSLKSKNGDPLYTPETGLHFLYSNDSPEKFLVSEYITAVPNETMSYHLSSSNVHALFEKMVENSLAATRNEAFDLCWNHFLTTSHGKEYFEELKAFLLDMVKQYSPDL